MANVTEDNKSLCQGEVKVLTAGPASYQNAPFSFDLCCDLTPSFYPLVMGKFYSEKSVT